MFLAALGNGHTRWGTGYRGYERRASADAKRAGPAKAGPARP